MPSRPKTYRPNVGTGKRHVPPEMVRRSKEARGYDAAWRALRASHLGEHPLCVKCGERGLTVAATEVDHIRAHRGDDTLRLDAGNLRSLCKSCHSRKTATVDGGFGNKVKSDEHNDRAA